MEFAEIVVLILSYLFVGTLCYIKGYLDGMEE